MSTLPNFRPEIEVELARKVAPFIDNMMSCGYSLIEPDQRIWTADAAEELRRRIEDHPIDGTDQTQWQKLQIQLQGASRETILLAAEIVILRDHALAGSRRLTRIEHLNNVLELLDPVPAIPENTDQLLVNNGAAGFDPGQAFYGTLWKHLIWTAKFVVAWCNLSEDERLRYRQDPYLFQDVMLRVEDQPDIRNTLQYLAFPEEFEPISSQRMKTKIRDGLADRINTDQSPHPQTVDKDLTKIRAIVGKEHGQSFNFWDEGVREKWDPQANLAKPVDPQPLDKDPDDTTYSKKDFLAEVYLPEARYDRLRSLLLRKKNVILAGPPGVGKTYAAKRLAYSIMGEKDPSRIQMVQFHQSYSYEDFFMGYRPTAEGGFSLVDGPFYRFCQTARNDEEDRPYFFIIDEINRGNISKIFGELLLLIEADKRGQPITPLYKDEPFSVPANVHIIGMMNTADRSLAVLDYALRRRFGFFEMKPAFDSPQFQKYLEEEESEALHRLVDTVKALNAEIEQDLGLGRGFAIGHSYLTLGSPRDADDVWLLSVVEDELVPLLEEYWFDDLYRVDHWTKQLRDAVDG